MSRVLVIGLDAATFDLIEPWMAEGLLPNFHRLVTEGAWGRLESTIPPVTAVAWNAFATGKNAGKHGVFDFVRRQAGGYRIRVVDGRSRKAMPFWRLLDRNGLRAGVINVPMTYPPDQLEHGFLVSGFDAPGLDSDFAHPPHLKELLRQHEYVIHPTHTNLEDWRRSLFEVFENQKQVFWELYHTQPWDVLTMVFMQLDVAQHLFWRQMEMEDPREGDVIGRLYQEADGLLGEVLGALDDDTTLMVVSDHGAGPLKKAVSINRWLFQQGYLTLRKQGEFKGPFNRALLKSLTWLNMHLSGWIKTSLKARLAWMRDGIESYLVTTQVDWAKTRAFAIGEYGGITVNLQGRERKGIVPYEEYDHLRDEIGAKLLDLRDPDTGKRVIERVYRREEVYSGPYVEQAPDLVLDWDYAYDCRERVGPVHRDVFENEAIYIPFADYRKTGVHRRHGIFLMYGSPAKPGCVEGARLIDVAPTLFHLLGVPVPDDMDGRVLTCALQPDWLARHPVAYQTVEPDIDEGRVCDYSAGERVELKERLRALGYLD